MQVSHKFLKFVLISFICLINIAVYQWTVKEPLMGDALMHVADDTQLQRPSDFAKIFYLTKNPDYQEKYRIEVMNRPVFNELIITLEKKLFANNLINMRYLSLGIHLANAILAFYFIFLLYNSHKIAFLGALFLSLNAAYFYGLYEFGLSFSLWLTLFTLMSFIFILKYVRTSSLKYLFLTFLSFFLAVFTKESAMTLPFALIIFSIFVHLNENKNNSKAKLKVRLFDILKNKKVWLASLGLIIILIANLVLRYKKLGSITEIHAGIGASVAVNEILMKIVGYFLIAFNISVGIIPGYMALTVEHYFIPVLIIILAFFCWFFYRLIINLFKKNISTITGLLIFLILLVPIFKVSRNAPYYLDIPLIGIVICVCGLLNNTKSVFTKKSLLYIVPFLLVNNLYFQYISTKSDIVWLTKGQSQAAAMTNSIKALSKSDFQHKNTYMLSSLLSGGEFWVFNHGRIGSFFYANLNYDFDKTHVLDLRKEFYKGSTLIDFYYEFNFPNKLDFKPQILTNVVGFKQINHAPVSSNFLTTCNEDELFEIRGKLKKDADRSKLSPLILNFQRNQLDMVSKTYANFDLNLTPTGEFSINSLVPHNSSRMQLGISEESRSLFESLEINHYKLMKSSSIE